jgi:hypothetical protein
MTTIRFQRLLSAGFVCATPLAILTTVVSMHAHARPQPQPQGAAAGASASDATRQKAEQLFAKGVAAMQKRDWATAYQAFDESFAQRASHDAAANLAQAAFKLNRFAVAAQHFSVALRMMPTSEPPKRKAAVERAFEEAKKEVTAVSVTVEPADARVLVDGTPQPLDAVFLEPGEHTIEARAEGFETKREKVVAVKGGSLQLAFSLQKAQAPAGGEGGAAPVPTGREQAPPRGGAAGGGEPGGSSMKTTFLITGAGLTVLSLGVGIGFGLDSRSATDDAEALSSKLGANGCSGSSSGADCASLQEKRDRANRNANVATIGFVGAGVFGAATAAIWLAWPDAKPRSARAVQVTPVLGVTSGMAVRGRF